jgi:hypothetical protein
MRTSAGLRPEARTVFAPPALSECALVVDGLFGIGLTRPLEGNYAEWIASINRAGVPVLALDIPSGLDANSGLAHGPVVQATHHGDVHCAQARLADRGRCRLRGKGHGARSGDRRTRRRRRVRQLCRLDDCAALAAGRAGATRTRVRTAHSPSSAARRG